MLILWAILFFSVSVIAAVLAWSGVAVAISFFSKFLFFVAFVCFLIFVILLMVRSIRARHKDREKD